MEQNCARVSIESEKKGVDGGKTELDDRVEGFGISHGALEEDLGGVSEEEEVAMVQGKSEGVVKVGEMTGVALGGEKGEEMDAAAEIVEVEMEGDTEKKEMGENNVGDFEGVLQEIGGEKDETKPGSVRGKLVDEEASIVEDREGKDNPDINAEKESLELMSTGERGTEFEAEEAKLEEAVVEKKETENGGVESGKDVDDVIEVKESNAEDSGNMVETIETAQSERKEEELAAEGKIEKVQRIEIVNTAKARNTVEKVDADCLLEVLDVNMVEEVVVGSTVVAGEESKAERHETEEKAMEVMEGNLEHDTLESENKEIGMVDLKSKEEEELNEEKEIDIEEDEDDPGVKDRERMGGEEERKLVEEIKGENGGVEDTITEVLAGEIPDKMKDVDNTEVTREIGDVEVKVEVGLDPQGDEEEELEHKRYEEHCTPVKGLREINQLMVEGETLKAEHKDVKEGDYKPEGDKVALKESAEWIPKQELEESHGIMELKTEEEKEKVEAKEEKEEMEAKEEKEEEEAKEEKEEVEAKEEKEEVEAKEEKEEVEAKEEKEEAEAKEEKEEVEAKEEKEEVEAKEEKEEAEAKEEKEEVEAKEEKEEVEAKEEKEEVEAKEEKEEAEAKEEKEEVEAKEEKEEVEAKEEKEEVEAKEEKEEAEAKEEKEEVEAKEEKEEVEAKEEKEEVEAKEEKEEVEAKEEKEAEERELVEKEQVGEKEEFEAKEEKEELVSQVRQESEKGSVAPDIEMKGQSELAGGIQVDVLNTKVMEQQEESVASKKNDEELLQEKVGATEKNEFPAVESVFDEKKGIPLENPVTEVNGTEVVGKEELKAPGSTTSCCHGDSEYEMDAMERYEAEEKELLLKSIKYSRVVLTVGKTNSGKSAALNNIFNLQGGAKFEKRFTVISKKVSTQGKNVIVIDTPGLGQYSESDQRIMEEVRKELKQFDFTVVYCLSVSPDSSLGDQDRAIVKLLHWHLGYSIWSKCVLLLTFSDTARREVYGSSGDVGEYRNYIKHRAKQFYNLVRSCGATVPGVLTVYDYEYYYKLMSSDLVAVPVGNCRSLQEAELSVVPGLGSEEKHWTYFARNEIRRKTCKIGHHVFEVRKYVRETFIDVSMCALLASFGGFLYGLRLDTSAQSYRTWTVLKIGGYQLQAFVLGHRNYWAVVGFSACWLALFPFGVFWVARKWRRGYRQLQGEREAVSRISF